MGMEYIETLMTISTYCNEEYQKKCKLSVNQYTLLLTTKGKLELEVLRSI
jgi:hypothetical protein